MSETRTPMCCQRLCGPQSPAGNPRRLWVVYDTTGNPMEVYDEGYSGRPDGTKGLVELSNIQIPASEYNAWFREWFKPRRNGRPV